MANSLTTQALQEEIKILMVMEKRVLQKDYARFAREAWKVLEPGNPLSDCQYIDAICETMQAMREGQVQRQIINQPPRTGKSLFVSVIFPCWVWTTQPSMRFCFYSYAYSLSASFNILRRRLIQSHWYQSRWGSSFYMSYDENRADFFSNSKTGHMSVLTGATGKGGNFLIVDDPHSVEEALSDAERTSGVTKVREGLLTRLDQPHKDCVCVVMQRLHDQDVTGQFLKDGGWTHLCLQAEAKKAISVPMPISKTTWHRKKGDLLDPIRLSSNVLAQKKIELGSKAFHGQYQQEPAPPGGLIFKTEWWRFYDKLPPMEQKVVSVDASFGSKSDTASDVAIHAWGMLGISSYLIQRSTDKRSFAETKSAVRDFMKRHEADFVLIEKKANGAAIIEELEQEFVVIPIDPDWGDKVARAEACSPQVEAHIVFLPSGSDGVYMQTVAAKFPNAETDDVDAMTQFLNWRRKRGATMEWFKAMAKKVEAEGTGGDQAEAKRIEHPTPQEVQRLANEAAGMKMHKPSMSKQVKTGDLQKDAPVIEQRCTNEECKSTQLWKSKAGAKCMKCGNVMPNPSREVNIG